MDLIVIPRRARRSVLLALIVVTMVGMAGFLGACGDGSDTSFFERKTPAPDADAGAKVPGGGATPSPGTGAGSPFGPMRFDVRFDVANFPEGMTGDVIPVMDGGELIVSDDVVGSIVFAGDDPNEENLIPCGGLRLDLGPGQVTATSDDTYAGTGGFFIALMDTPCPTGTVPESEFFGPIPGQVTITVSGQNLSGAVVLVDEEEGRTSRLPFVGTLASD